MKLFLSTLLLFSFLNSSEISIRDVFSKETQAKSLGGLKDNKNASEDGIGNVILGLNNDLELKKEIAANKLLLNNDLNNQNINDWLSTNNVNNNLLNDFDIHKSGHNFNGKNFLITEYTSLLNMSEYSIFLSFNPSKITGSQTLVSYGETFDTDIMGFQVYLEDDKVKLWFEDQDTVDYIYTSNSNIKLNEWTNLLIIKKNDKVEFYLNGELDSIYDSISTNLNLNHMLTIGVKTNSGNRYESFYSGSIEKIKIYNYSLDNNEISNTFTQNYSPAFINYDFYNNNISETNNQLTTKEILFN